MNCHICKGKLGLKFYKRKMPQGQEVLVCSKACQKKPLPQWGGGYRPRGKK